MCRKKERLLDSVKSLDVMKRRGKHGLDVVSTRLFGSSAHGTLSIKSVRHCVVIIEYASQRARGPFNPHGLCTSETLQPE